MKRCKIHVVAQSHIDVAWLWQYDPETIDDCCKFTFMKAIDNLERHREYSFAQSQPLLYEATEKHFPDIFSEIGSYIREGRWDAIGGMYVEPECAEPCGEALVRQCLLGQRYFKEKFGVMAKVAWLPDTWTYPWQLPQILKKSGLEYLLFSRWGDKGEELLWWQAPDGSRVLAYKGWYWKYRFTQRPFPNLKELASSINRRYDVENILLIIGSGDHGGGPTHQEILNIKELASSLEPDIEVKFSKPHEFFHELEKEAGLLPIVNDELGYQLGGSLTTCSELKRSNRLSESMLLSVERFSVIANMLTGLAYPRKALNESWKKILFNQFHDAIGGCVIPAAQRYGSKLYREVLEHSSSVLRQSLKAISSKIETSEDMNIVVFNSMAWSRTDLVHASVSLPRNCKTIGLLDSEGVVVPVQITGWEEDAGNVRADFIFEAENVPSMGYKTFGVLLEGGPTYPNLMKVTENEIENEFFRIRLSSDTGCVDSILDKANDREIIGKGGKGNLLELVEDPGDSEGFLIPSRHSDKDVDNVKKMNRYSGEAHEICSEPTIEIVERGPVRCILRVNRTSLGFEYTQEVVAYSKMKRVDFNLVVDWHEVHKALKVSFPVNVHDPALTFETQFGSIARQPNGKEQPVQKWVDLSEPDGSYGVSLLNDSRYGCDSRNGNSVRLTILRSPTEPAYNTDEGIHETKYALYPHKGDWRSSDVVQKGFDFNNPLISMVEKGHPGILPKTGSFLSLTPANLIVTAMKKSEDSEDVILRLYEAAGEKTEGEISLDLMNKAVEEACKTNLLEDGTSENVNVDGNKLKLTVEPCEIATLRVRLA